jgi:pantoate--beta-alanine ligase
MKVGKMKNEMKIFHTVKDLQDFIACVRIDSTSIGFVPTMGALHQGHISLVKRACNENTIVIASIFVNPTQFNNLSDLEKYPRTIQNDCELLKSTACTAVFIPSISEVYPDHLAPIDVDLIDLENKLEGKFRPGHFKGVVQVVHRLFDIVQPNNAYFGLKDFQQVAVIKQLVKDCSLPVNVIPCETLRERSGLAMSSRNTRLSEQQKTASLIIFQTLQFLKNASKTVSPIRLKKEAEHFFNTGDLKLEYLEIVDPVSLETLNSSWVPGTICCIAAFAGDVRLIDNMEIF